MRPDNLALHKPTPRQSSGYVKTQATSQGYRRRATIRRGAWLLWAAVMVLGTVALMGVGQ